MRNRVGSAGDGRKKRLSPGKGTWVGSIAVGVAVWAVSSGGQLPTKSKSPTQLPIQPLPILPGVYVEKNAQFSFGASEIQSTVVPAAKKPNAPYGRVLFVNDNLDDAGQIAYFDLNRIHGEPKYSVIDPLPSADYRVVSNDGDIVTLKNGDVLYIRMGRSKKPLSPKPSWFDWTYKINYEDSVVDLWGKGVRSCIMVWRSQDAGETFKFLSVLDTAKLDDDWGTANDGSGGLPQGDPYTKSPGSVAQPIWQMGGTDGPLARVDPATGRVFMTVRLVGRRPESNSPFKLSGTTLSRTYVAMSSDGGASWQKAGNLGTREWRTDVVPRENDVLTFGLGGRLAETGNFTTVIDHAKIGSFPDPESGHLVPTFPEPQGPNAWSVSPKSLPLYTDKNKGVSAAIMTEVVLMRSPSSQHVMVATPDTLEGNQGHGYRLYLYRGGHDWVKLPDIAPAKPNPNSFIFHVTVADPGTGPLLVYWYDIDDGAATATIRGRILVRDEQWTSDFPISLNGTMARSFTLKPKRGYGDYHTAGAYKLNARKGGLTTYEFLPVWVEPVAPKVHFARVRFRESATPVMIDQGPLRLKFLGPMPKDRVKHSVRVAVRKLQFPDSEEDDR